jgi:CDP-diacylglycerol--glycerol-3-phosphate 3-phosphatidyltransferase
VQHLKAYVFDDELIMSGANLSRDYFTNRQDRYFRMVRAGDLAAHYHGLVDRLMPFSDTIDAVSGAQKPPRAGPKRDAVFRTRLTNVLRKIARSGAHGGDGRWQTPDWATADTWAIPSLQLARLGCRQDEMMTETLLRALSTETTESCGLAHDPAAASLDMATAYYNLPDAYVELLLARASRSPETNPRRTRLLMASPAAHGFAGAEGASAALPLAYAELLRRFHNLQRQTLGPSHAAAASLHEWTREGWTYHAKGCWVEEKDATRTRGGPWLSVVGSSNFGRRSVEHDLESQLYVATTNESLRAAWGAERDALFAHGEKVADETFDMPDRRLCGWSWRRGHWIRGAAPIAASYM